MHVLHLVCGDPQYMNRLCFQLEMAEGHVTSDVLVTDGRYYPGSRFGPAVPSPRLRRTRVWRMLRGLRVICLLVRHPADVLHAHEHGTLLFVFFWCALLRRRVVWDPHDMYLHIPAAYVKVHRAGLKRALERYAIRRGAPVAVVSNGMRRCYACAYPNARIELLCSLPAGTKAPLHTDAEARQQARLRRDPGTLHLVYPGLLLRSRIEPAFIEAIARTANVTLDIYGQDRSGRYEAKLEALIAAQRIRNVRLMGPYAPERLPDLLASYHFGVMPFVVESENTDFCMPNKFYQCMQAGLPVLISDMQELGAEVRAHGVGRVFREGDYQAWMDWMSSFDPGAPAYGNMVRSVARYRSEQMSTVRERTTLLALYQAAF